MTERASPHPEAEDLSAWVDREGTASELAAVEAHVALCETCRALARTFERTAHLVGALPRERADEALIARTAQVARTSRAPRRGLAWTAVAAAGVLLGAFVTYQLVLVQQAEAPALMDVAIEAPKKSDARASVAVSQAPPEPSQGSSKLAAERSKPQVAPVEEKELHVGFGEGLARDGRAATAQATEAEVARPVRGGKREASRNASADDRRAASSVGAVAARPPNETATASTVDDDATSPVDDDATSPVESRRRQEVAELEDAGTASRARDEADHSNQARLAEPQAKAAAAAPAAPAAAGVVAALPGVMDAAAARKDEDGLAASTPIAISPGVQAPILVHRVLPRVPRTVTQGRVVLEVVVSERGNVRVTRVTSATPGLERSVVEAVEQWRYQPARLNGRDQAVRMTVVVDHPWTD